MYIYVCVYVYTHMYVLSICKLMREGKKKKNYEDFMDERAL